MATKLKEFDFTKQSSITTTEKVNYPWEQWFDGDIWQLTEGEDFLIHPLMMERIIRTRATGRHAKIKLRHIQANGDRPNIVFQRTDVKGPREQKREAMAAARKAKATAKNGTPAKKVPSKRAAPVKRVTKKVSAD